MPPDAPPPTISLDPDLLVRQLDRWVDTAMRLLPNLALALVVFLGFLMLGRGVRALLRRVTAGHGAAHLGLVLGRLAQATILFVGLMLAVSIVVPSIGGAELLQLLGIGGVAIGFAFRDILQNFVAGLLLLLRQPFRIGDQIVYKEFEGTVEAIETRATLLKTYDGTRVHIPNGELFTNAFRLQTAYPARRSEYDVGVGYGDDVEAAADAFLDALRAIDGVRDDPAPDVLVWGLDASDVKLRVRWWTAPRRADVLRVRGRVLLALRRVAAERGIDLPFPTQVVLFHDQTEPTDGDRTAQREGWPARPGDTPRAPGDGSSAPRSRPPAETP